MGVLLAVHISDYLLTAPWWLGGFGLTAVLAYLGTRRLRDEEIPQIAVLTSAFFIASLIHVRVGPTSVHLLLNGLMGVVLGWRAAVAIPLAVFLQAVLFGHGGFTTIGVNSCVMILPALAAHYLFRCCQSLPWLRRPWFRSTLVGVSCLVLVASAIVSISLVFALPSQAAGGEGIALIEPALQTARDLVLQPWVLAFVLLCTGATVVAERKLENYPEFPLGLVIGELTVLATVALNCVVLLTGGEQNWSIPVSIQVVAHLPVAVVEGVVLGFTVGLLARVRPDILGIKTSVRLWPLAHTLEQNDDVQASAQPAANGTPIRNLQSAIPNQKQTYLLAFLLLVLLPPAPAWAHRLRGEYRILPGQKVRVEGWFDLTADAATGAIVQVLRENGEILTEGKLDEKGTFSFSLTRPEALRIIISAGAGHREELRVSQAELENASSKQSSTSAAYTLEPTPTGRRPALLALVLKGALGVGAVSALAVFVLAWRRRHKNEGLLSE